MKKPTKFTELSTVLLKRFATLACAFGVATLASGQGLVNFFNNSTTLVSMNTEFFEEPYPLPGIPGSHYFGLLTAPPGSSEMAAFTFSGVYGTNQAVAGRFSGGVNIPVSGWAPGEARAVMVFGWSAANGHDFNPGWLNGTGQILGLMSHSEIAPALVAGGGAFNIPTANVFGGEQGIQHGFAFVRIPEPSVVALTCGGVMFLALRRSCRLAKRNQTCQTPRG